MSLVAALPTPPSPPVLQFLTNPSLGTMPTGVSRTNAGIDTRRGVAPVAPSRGRLEAQSLGRRPHHDQTARPPNRRRRRVPSAATTTQRAPGAVGIEVSAARAPVFPTRATVSVPPRPEATNSRPRLAA